MQTGTQAIDRAAQLLVLVVESEESSSVGELAEAAGLPKSTVSRALSALERQGLVQREGVPRRRPPGPGAARPRPPRRQRRRHRRAAAPSRCERLGDAERRDDRPGACRCPAAPSTTWRRSTAATSWAPPTGSAAGCRTTARRSARCCMAFGAAPAAEAGRWSRMTADTITDPAALRGSWRRCGRADSRTAVGELEPGLVARCGAGVRSRRPPLAAISISGPGAAAAAGAARRAGELLLTDETTRLSARLGQRPAKEGAA